MDFYKMMLYIALGGLALWTLYAWYRHPILGAIWTVLIGGYLYLVPYDHATATWQPVEPVTITECGSSAGYRVVQYYVRYERDGGGNNTVLVEFESWRRCKTGPGTLWQQVGGVRHQPLRYSVEPAE